MVDALPAHSFCARRPGAATSARLVTMRRCATPMPLQPAIPRARRREKKRTKKEKSEGERQESLGRSVVELAV